MERLLPPGLLLLIATLFSLLPRLLLAEPASAVALFITSPDGDLLKHDEPAAQKLFLGRQEHTFKLRNSGATTVTDLVVTSYPETSLAATLATIPSLAPGAEATFQVSAEDLPDEVQSDIMSEARFVTYQVSEAGAAEYLFRFTIDYRFYPYSSLFHWVTPTRLLLAGEPATFTTQTHISYIILQHTWRRDNRKVGTDDLLKIDALKLSDAGVYSQQLKHESLGVFGDSQGTSTSPPMPLGVVQPAPATAYAYESKPFSLTCTASSPGDYPLSYQWLRNGEPMEDIEGVTGSSTATLHLEADHALSSGSFDCQVTLAGPDRTVSLRHGITTVLRAKVPEILPEALHLGFGVHQLVDYQLPASDPIEGLKIKGRLPPGLKISPTGRITGRPTKVSSRDKESDLYRPYQVTLTPSNGAGEGPSADLDIVITPICPPGTYANVLPRHPDFAGSKNLGGYVQVTVTSAGSFSGRLTHGGKVYRFTRPRLPIDAPNQIGLTYDIPISLGRGQPSINLRLYSFDTLLHSYLSDPEGHEIDAFLGQQIDAADALREAGSYSLFFRPDPAPTADPEAEPGPQIPPGSGYLTLKLSSKSLATWKGKLADGTVITGSAPRMQLNTRAIPLHQPLYKATGSLQGEISLWSPLHLPPYYDPKLTWFKAAETGKRNRIYPDGIRLHDLKVLGDQTYPLEKDYTFWNLPTSGYPLRLTFTGVGLPAEGLIQYAGITEASRIHLDPENQSLKSFSIDLKTRAFKGSFHILPPESTTPLTLPFEGALTYDEGGGYFLIPEAPEEGPLNVKTAPLHSGKVSIQRVR